MRMKKIICALMIFCTLVACNDFVDVVPKGNTIPETVDDLAKLINVGSMVISQSGESWSITYETAYSLGFFVEVYSDDYTASENPASAMYMVHRNSTIFQNTLKWNDYIYSAAENDANWDGLYRGIYITNYVLDHIDEVRDGVSNKRSEVKGQALVHRAMNYFQLVNLYGKQYNTGTSVSDPGVPLVLESDINKQYPRETVARIYEQLLTDLEEAIRLLEVEVPEFNNNPGKAAAYALRARVYLWQQNYDQAYADAAEALKLQSELIDYNTCMSSGMPMMVIGYPMLIHLNPEVMYARYRSERSSASFSDKMLGIIDPDNDLRYQLFYGPWVDNGYLDPGPWARHCHSGINTSEVWLTKAEAALRKSAPDVAEAIEALDYVRDRRYKNRAYSPAPTDPDLLLTEILNERRREITFTEMSFLDRKRQNADPVTARPMSRTVYGETYTMPVGDPHYQLPIPLNVMEFNPLLVQNDR